MRRPSLICCGAADAVAAIRPRSAPPLDPRAVAQLRRGRVPAQWLGCGGCRPCGPVLLPGENRDYGELPECPWCPWCLVRRGGGRLPSLAFVRARLREHWTRLPEDFRTWRPLPEQAQGGPAGEPPGPAADRPVLAGKADAGFTRDAGGAARPALANRLPASGMNAGAGDPEGDSVGHIAEVPHHPRDTTWIEAQLSRRPDPRQRAALRRRYGELYRAAFAAEPNPIRKEGRARFASNGDLREEVEALAGAPGGFDG